ncbi:unnamed protein product [Didymodactylos carnosus]|uniref:Uncharacterized protein n=1 Tax=Didymodactylos carnosus TaxID=1234261 RepID=A0A815H403_9BILA|nr:unnamed protein product [Didymodactylos carnosus]CAF1347137.1 unnamed protein product [Didymodactylos carnosus]CAF4008514.1 unnamed protein product [Didymodactylos carnosus]CAF4214005.1 unnamed protein product [Didymodactylos carnosus]
MINQTLDSSTISTAVVAEPCGCPSCNIKMQKEQHVHGIKCPRSNEQFEGDQLLQTPKVLDGCEVEKQDCSNEFQKMSRCLSISLRCCKEVPDCDVLEHR